MNPNRARWNRDQKSLRQALTDPQAAGSAIEFFLRQHAAVHAAAMSASPHWSFADEVWQGLEPDDLRKFPSGSEHSMAWIFWHLARIEDVTMNLLVAGGSQVLNEGGWGARLQVTARDTGNLMNAQNVIALSQAIDLDALQAYRQAVGRRTRQIVSGLNSSDILQKVRPDRLERIQAEGAVVPAASDLLAYWGKLTIAGLLLMPPTRHCFLHLNEALRIRQRLKRKSRG